MNLPAIHRQPAELSMREPSNFASLVQRSRFTRGGVVRWGQDVVVSRRWRLIGGTSPQCAWGVTRPTVELFDAATERVVLDLLDFLG